MQYCVKAPVTAPQDPCMAVKRRWDRSAADNQSPLSTPVGAAANDVGAGM